MSVDPSYGASRTKISEILTDLEKAIEEKEASNAQKETEQQGRVSLSKILPSPLDKIAGAYATEIETFVRHGQNTAQSILRKSRRELEQKPWAFLGKAAAVGFCIGLLMGARGRKSKRERL